MRLGFLVRRCAPSTAPATRVASVALSSVSALFSSSSSSGGPGSRSWTRRLLSGGAALAAERAHAHADARSTRRDPWGAPDGGRPDAFPGAGGGSSVQNFDGFHRGNPGEFPGSSCSGGSLRGGSNVGETDVGGSLERSFGRGNPGEASGGAYSDGSTHRGQWRLDGFQRAISQGDDLGGTESCQLNLDRQKGVSPGHSYLGSHNAIQGTYGFPGSTPGDIQSNSSANFEARPADESAEAAGSSSLQGTVDELDRFLQEDKAKEGVEVLRLLEKHGTVLDPPRYLKLMHVCGEGEALEEARFVHGHILRTNENLDMKVQNGILDMYCKCGSTDDAYEWFDKMPWRNFTSWDTMIVGLADNGLGDDAIDLFNRFLQMGLKPDDRMFIAVFHVCSTLGAVDEGMLHFESMSKIYGITPAMEHYVSVVDMLGQAGYLDEAVEFIEMMPIEPGVDVWESLMNCSSLQGNVELADRCAEIVETLDPSRPTSQSKAGLLPMKESERERKKADLREVISRVHEYRAGDRSHPETDRIYALIKGLAVLLRESGYVPETRFVLHDIDQESKEEALLAHSERLATAHALIGTAARQPIRIIKNLRICGDCHSYMKIVSKLVGRKLTIRDAKRFHHFEDGACSCKDYW